MARKALSDQGKRQCLIHILINPIVDHQIRNRRSALDPVDKFLHICHTDLFLSIYDEMRQRHIRNGQMENAFVEAIRNEEFVVYLQPKYSVETEEIVGAEALVRWKRAEGTMVSPGEFIPLFEKDGLIVRLDEYVFRKVCSIQGERIRSGKKILPISVNLSRASIHYDNMICRYVKIVEENGIPFSSVPIELTETAGSSLS